jgi:hypothetical protein
MENIFQRDIIPPNEKQRLEALKRYLIINTAREPFFDNIVYLTAQTFEVPMALISLVDLNQVIFKASFGANDLKRVPRGSSLCAIAILGAIAVIGSPYTKAALATMGASLWFQSMQWGNLESEYMNRVKKMEFLLKNRRFI